MNIYEVKPISELIKGNSYVGRGIAAGLSKDGKKACSAYFIMGRSANSRNRIFEKKDGNIYTKPFDESKVEDPSLIIYSAVKTFESSLIVTNGDQTDTVYDGLKCGKSFAESLTVRKFEPDSPNFTPRISAVLDFKDRFSYSMSILKSENATGDGCARYNFSYEPLCGLGHFIHTYICDGDPIPTFCGEPERIIIPDDIDEFTDSLWNSLDADNKISLYVRYTDLESKTYEDRLINKNE